MSQSSQNGLDDVDGALFSRIPSKQCELDKSTGKDRLDGVLFSRIPSQKNATGSKKADDSLKTLECTIKPEDLSDEDNADGDIKCDKENSGSSSSSLAASDHSDGIQGSRTNLQQIDDEPELEITRHTSSTFYTQPPSSDNLSLKSEPKANTSESAEVSFYAGDTEGGVGETPESNTTGQEQIELSVLRNGDTLPPSNEQTPLSARDEQDSSLSSEVTSCSRSNCWPVTKSLIFPILSLGVYFWDIGSDIHLAITYKENGDDNLFWITLACILIPHILMAVVDVSWVWLDRKRANTCRMILGCLTLGRVVRSFNYMYHIYKVKIIPKGNDKKVVSPGGHTRRWYKGRAQEEKRDCFYLDFINAFMESAPQLFVQLYLYYAYDLELTVIRVMNLLSSWVSIAWTYAAYYRSNREVLAGKQDVDVLGFAFFICAILALLAARFICTTLFLVNYPVWIGGLCIFVHFFVILLWICFKERPKLEGTIACKSGRFLYYIFFAYVSILCFMNLSDGKARVKMTLFYLVIYIENTVMMILSYLRLNETGSGKEKHLFVLPFGFVLNVILLIIYYQCLHPKAKNRLRCKFPCTNES